VRAHAEAGGRAGAGGGGGGGAGSDGSDGSVTGGGRGLSLRGPSPPPSPGRAMRRLPGSAPSRPPPLQHQPHQPQHYGQAPWGYGLPPPPPPHAYPRGPPPVVVPPLGPSLDLGDLLNALLQVRPSHCHFLSFYLQ
jgi:hypothetical protein